MKHLEVLVSKITYAIVLCLYPKSSIMGLIYAEIELINGDDLALERKYIIDKDEVKRMRLTVLVDTSSYMLCINESIQEQMQFPVVEKRKAETADGRIVECDVVSSVELRFKNRATSCRAMVLPGNNEPLLGAIPLEDMPARLPYLKIL